ncbi:hypothetical protein [Flavobacterium sp. LB2P74]|uniref:hypothetical protein n=1 Tax=Flavobacterium sp. LB2P74 TaxID=3401717 RepID=UPI003AAB3693
MEYFILNEHSLPITDTDKIDSCLIQFFEIYKLATKKNFKQIRVSNNIDSSWYELSISEHKSLREWVKEQTSDYSSRLKSLISSTQCPIYSTSQFKEQFRSDLSEFKYKGLSVPNLGATFLLQQLSFSFDSSEIWNYSILTVKHLELTEQELIIDTEVDVKNVTNQIQWNEHYKIIESLQIEIISKSKEIIRTLNIHFPNIKFTNSAVKQLNNNQFTPTFFNEIWSALKDLNDAIVNLTTDLNCETVKTKSSLNISDESDTVKQNPKLNRHRLFMYNDQQHFFGYHIKNFRNNERIHFIVSENKIIVGYIGKHLPL